MSPGAILGAVALAWVQTKKNVSDRLKGVQDDLERQDIEAAGRKLLPLTIATDVAFFYALSRLRKKRKT